jgi:hypothetical protein
MQTAAGQGKVRAIELRDARVTLGELVNVLSPQDRPGQLDVLSSQDPPCTTRAEVFLRNYGPLRMKNSIAEVLEFARRFRQAWWAKTEEEKQVINSFLDEIFARGDPFSQLRPAIAADFGAGKWEPRPRNLLDVLAISLMRSRTMLYRCERPECQRYFVKEHSRDRYCSYSCGKEMRKSGQDRWQREHRDKVNAKRRKQKKVFKRDAPLRKQ